MTVLVWLTLAAAICAGLYLRGRRYRHRITAAGQRVASLEDAAAEADRLAAKRLRERITARDVLHDVAARLARSAAAAAERDRVIRLAAKRLRERITARDVLHDVAARLARSAAAVAERDRVIRRLLVQIQLVRAEGEAAVGVAMARVVELSGTVDALARELGKRTGAPADTDQVVAEAMAALDAEAAVLGIGEGQ